MLRSGLAQNVVSRAMATLKPAPGLNSKVLAEGSSCPPYDGKQIRLYNMRFCPYGQRGLIALGVKELPFEIVNVDLKNKAGWFLAKNPLGKVPTFDLPDGRVIYESAVCLEYLEEVYPGQGKPLLPEGAFARAEQKMITEVLTAKLVGAMYAMLRDADCTRLKEGLTVANSMLKNDYFGGSSPSFSDYMMWPFFERIQVICAAHRNEIDINSFPAIVAYLDRMLRIPAIKIYSRPAEEHLAFIKTFKEGNPDYDYGIAEKSKQ